MKNLKSTTSEAVKKANYTNEVLNRTEGITLIALIVTVIVMLILAGVAISALMGNKGLFVRTENAVTFYEEASKKENDNIQGLLNELDTVIKSMNYKNPEEVAKIGDFVNYSVEVNGVVYDKWRILNFDNNGRMEIVCYNGPDFTLGSAEDAAKSKSDYANAIKLLNAETEPYGEGLYGNSTRHLGSDPSNSDSYETIDESYVEYYSDFNSSGKPKTNLEYLEQYHHKNDVESIKIFSDTQDGKKLAGEKSWLASRRVDANAINTYFRVRYVYSSGEFSNLNLYTVSPEGSESTINGTYALAPVVSLESGVKIDTSLEGDGSMDNAWKLAE